MGPVLHASITTIASNTDRAKRYRQCEHLKESEDVWKEWWQNTCAEMESSKRNVLTKND